MAKLTETDKQEIVVLLAQFQSPSSVAAHMRRENGLDIDRFQVRCYDPTKPKFEAGEKWREIFWAARRSYLESVDAVPISHQAYRLNELQRNYDKASAIGNLVLANKTLEQAAKEVRSITAKDKRANSGEDEAAGYRSMTPNERRDLVADMLRSVMDSDEEHAPQHTKVN